MKEYPGCANCELQNNVHANTAETTIATYAKTATDANRARVIGGEIPRERKLLHRSTYMKIADSRQKGGGQIGGIL